MQKKEIINQIQKELIQLEQLVLKFKTTENIHLIEIDICHDKLKNMYQELILLKQFYTDGILKRNPQFSDKEDIANNKPDEVLIEDITEELLIEEEEESIVEEQELEAPKKQDSAIQSIPHRPTPKDSSESKVKNIKYRHPKGGYSKDIIGDNIERKTQSVNDIIAQKKFEKDISSKFNTQVINDINKAINLNDKIWFTKALFNGNSDSYKETISKLNSTSDFNAALNYIKSNFDWDTDEKAVEKFIRIVSRRFV